MTNLLRTKIIATVLAFCFGIILTGCSIGNPDEIACKKYMNWYLAYEQGPPPATEDEEPGQMKLMGAWQVKLASHYADWAERLDALRKEAKSIEIRRVANAASDYWKLQSENLFPFATALSEGSNELAKTLAKGMRPIDKNVMAKHIDAIDSACAPYSKSSEN